MNWGTSRFSGRIRPSGGTYTFGRSLFFALQMRRVAAFALLESCGFSEAPGGAQPSTGLRFGADQRAQGGRAAAVRSSGLEGASGGGSAG